jgi:NADPH:quinone reductase-like Zn-dependent oxidoreductase
VALRSSALNHLDRWIALGKPRPPAFPHVPGADGAGVVIEIGGEVADLAPGDEVVIDPATSCGRCAACLAGDEALCPDLAVVGEHRWGTHAEAVVVPAVNAVRKPARLTWEEAGAFGLVTASAVRMLRRGRVGAGTDVLVVGVGGGSAIAAFLVARAVGARVFATSRGEAGRTWAETNGAASVFDSEDAYAEAVRKATGGRGVDVVVDNVGTATFGRSIAALARGGRLVTNGSTSGRTAEIHVPTLFWRQLELIGSSMNDRSDFAEAVRLVGEDEVRLPLEPAFAFDSYTAALARLGDDRRVGKISLNR